MKLLWFNVRARLLVVTSPLSLSGIRLEIEITGHVGLNLIIITSIKGHNLNNGRGRALKAEFGVTG